MNKVKNSKTQLGRIKQAKEQIRGVITFGAVGAEEQRPGTRTKRAKILEEQSLVVLKTTF